MSRCSHCLTVGAIKDAWAPDCSIQRDVSGNTAAVSPECLAERGGLRATLILVAAWLLWTCIYFAIALALQRRRVARSSKRAPLLDAAAMHAWDSSGSATLQGLTGGRADIDKSQAAL
eukprot:6988-Heterococcus_DN1.PRE.2